MIGESNRLFERRRCNMACRIDVAGGTVSCRIVDISPNGVGLIAQGGFGPRVSDQCIIRDGELAGLSGVIQWVSSPRFGVEFSSRHRGSPKVLSLYNSISG
jgi:PilZ domain